MQVIIQFFKEMSTARLAATAITTILLFVLFIIYFLKVNDTDYAVLYSDLELQDSAKVVQELENQKVPYQALYDGSVIKVPKSKVIGVRLSLAQAGLPNSGSLVGYEIFDKEDSIGTTNFAQNVKFVRALEGELSRTISAFDQVTKARVHLVIPRREIFSKERVEPRASIVLKLRGSSNLRKSEIDAISHLVITAVPSLEMKSISIVDTKGRALKIGSAEDSMDFASGKNDDIRIANENRLKKDIENLLESTLGAGKVKVRVALEMNFDRIITNSELYDPEGAVVRSVQAIDAKEKTPVGEQSGGDASVANNIPGEGGGSAEGAEGNFAIIEKSDQTTNYEISKTIKNHITESGVITKMSIGILVDGNYKTDPETEESIYETRSKEDLDKIANLVKVAIGFNEDRDDKIEVINMQFSNDLDGFDEDDSEWLKQELPDLIQTLILAIVVLLVLITVIRPIAMKAFEIRQAEEGNDVIGPDGQPVPAGSAAAGGVEGAPGEELSAEGVAGKEEKQVPPLERINNMVDTDPESLVLALRKWLNEG
ncbi:MAG: flagellar M-ring protein FliF [Rickettsiaceae bacterium]|nr:flagellar M-ring protein FliF [Rickettsiaceae bacterium]